MVSWKERLPNFFGFQQRRGVHIVHRIDHRGGREGQVVHGGSVQGVGVAALNQQLVLQLHELLVRIVMRGEGLLLQ